jgi:hypothetical protein
VRPPLHRLKTEGSKVVFPEKRTQSGKWRRSCPLCPFAFPHPKFTLPARVVEDQFPGARSRPPEEGHFTYRYVRCAHIAGRVQRLLTLIESETSLGVKP